MASLVVAPGQRTKCQDAAVLGSHARQKGSAGAADRKHGSAPGGDDKREQGRGGKGKYDKEYFKFDQKSQKIALASKESLPSEFSEFIDEDGTFNSKKYFLTF